MELGKLYRIKPGYTSPCGFDFTGQLGKFTAYGNPAGGRIPVVKFVGDAPAGYAEWRPWPLFMAVPEQFLEPAE